MFRSQFAVIKLNLQLNPDSPTLAVYVVQPEITQVVFNSFFRDLSRKAPDNDMLQAGGYPTMRTITIENLALRLICLVQPPMTGSWGRC
jgi:hypothetical protein